MRVWITGAEGMLGRWTARAGAAAGHELLTTGRDLEIQDLKTVEGYVHQEKPDAIINCAGRTDKGTPARIMLEANAIGPWVLACVAEWCSVRLVHVSTDCVFSGRPRTAAHKYKVSDLPDPADLYGRSKLAGEPDGDGVLTIRTSFIGWERGLGAFLKDSAGGIIDGWANAYWNGSTVQTVGRMLVEEAAGTRTGLHHAATAKKVSKAWLLRRLNEGAALGLTIHDKADPLIDRALDPTIELPPIEETLEELCQILR